MDRTQWLWVALIATVLLVVTVHLVNTPLARVWRYVPKRHRGAFVKRLLDNPGALFATQPAEPAHDAFANPELLPDATLALDLNQLPESPELIADARMVSSRRVVDLVVALDVDGSVVILEPTGGPGEARVFDTAGYRLIYVTPGGERRVVAEGAPHDRSWAEGVSVLKGSVSWWSTHESHEAELWLSVPGETPRVLDSRRPSTIRAKEWAGGETVVSSQAVAWTLVGGLFGDVGVTDFAGVSTVLSSHAMRWLTRDLESEAHAREAFACILGYSPQPAGHELTRVDLTPSPFSVTPMRRGLFPGPTVAAGEVAGFRYGDRTLELPGGIWVRIDTPWIAKDVAATHEWAGFSLVHARPPVVVEEEVIVHLPTTKKLTLANSGLAPVEIRGSYVMWKVFPPRELGVEQNVYMSEAYVARLVPPAATAGGPPSEEPPLRKEQGPVA